MLILQMRKLGLWEVSNLAKATQLPSREAGLEGQRAPEPGPLTLYYSTLLG